MPQLDPSSFASQIFWLIVTFVALYLIMWRVVVPRISDVLEARRERAEDNLAKAETYKKDAEAALAAYDKAIADARAEAHAAVAEATSRMAETAAKQEAELARKLGERIAASEAEIAKAVAAAMGNVQAIATETAAAAAERLLGGKVDAAAVAKAVDATLKAKG